MMESDNPPTLVALASAALREWEAEVRREREVVQAERQALQDEKQRLEQERCVFVRHWPSGACASRITSDLCAKMLMVEYRLCSPLLLPRCATMQAD